MSIYNFATSPLAGASSAQGGVTEQSLKFDRASISYLSRTASSPTLGTKATWSFWIKKSDVSEDTSTSYRTVFWAGTPNVDGFRIGFARYSGNGHSLQINQDQGSSASYIYKLTNAFYRDVAGWYHFIISYDSTNATAADRIKVYTNGELASFRTSPSTNPSLNHIPKWQVSGTTLKIGDGFGGAYNEAIDMYLADVYFIDGQALDATSFGETVDGYWKKKDYTGSYGTNGFKLNFRDDTVSEGFNAVTWKGNSPLSQSISGLGFSPDLVWIKSRSQTYNHVLADTVRGQGKDLYSNTTGAESSTSSELISFDADGFSVGSGGSANDPTGSLGFVAWCWDAGNGSSVSNTDGTITSTVKANPAYGFSIVSYTGTGSSGTVGHGLSGKTPELIITKQRSSANPWPVNSGTLFSSGNMMFLDRTDGAVAGGSNALASYSGTTFGVSAQGATGAINDNGETYIAYCFAEVAGYSSIGSYSGTGSTVSVNTGFKAAWLLIKRTDTNGFSWVMLDNTRNPSGELDDFLLAETNIVETNNGTVRVLPTATGFDVTGTATSINASGGSYIYMAFADTREAAFWKDVSEENSNNWTPNNLDYRDSVFDSPTNNFAVLNNLDNISTTYSEGSLKISQSSFNYHSRGSFGLASGKYYWEVRMDSTHGEFGVCENGKMPQTDPQGAHPAYFIYNNGSAGVIYNNATSVSSSSATMTNWTANDVAMIAYDADNGNLYHGLNGVWQNSADPAAGTGAIITGITSQFGGELVPFFGSGTSSARNWIVNFGQDSTFSGAKPMGAFTDGNSIGNFQYAPPAGFLALCTANLPTPTIVDGSEHFNTVLYSGNDSTQSVTGVGFQPDLLWLKSRTNTNSHLWVDSVRGSGSNGLFYLVSNSTIAEVDGTNITSLDSDGFTLDSSAGTNGSGRNFVSWNWYTGASPTSNTDGSITSQVSANTAAGFSIGTFVGNQTAGATVGHGLSQAPEMIIIKDRPTVNDWPVYHASVGATAFLKLNAINAQATDSGLWNNTAPTASVFTLGSSNLANNNTKSHVFYAFHSVDGFSKVGSYIGNGSTDGSFVYTGFRPRYIILKRSSTASVTYGWQIYDTARSPYNKALLPGFWADVSVAEADNTYPIDLLSNGFKLRSGNANNNASGNTYIYLAFAEVPFKVANAR
jgi:hypothetical protein